MISTKNEKSHLSSTALKKHNQKNFETEQQQQQQQSVSDTISNERQDSASSEANPTAPSAGSAQMLPPLNSNSLTTAANTTAGSQSNTALVNQMMATMFSNSSISSVQSGGNDIVPIAFMSVNALQQMMMQQKFLADLHTTNKSQIDASTLSRQSIESTNGNKLWVNTGFSNSSVSTCVSNVSSPVSTSVILAPNCTNKFDAPNIELNMNEIDFGPVAEGCSDIKRVFFKLNNLPQHG